MNFKTVQLTKFMVKIGPGARTGTVTKAWKKGGVTEKWQETDWAKRQVAKQARAAMSDFDRLDNIFSCSCK